MTGEAWKDILALLRQRLEPGDFKVWIESLVGGFDGTEYVVHAVSGFAAGFVRDNYLAAIRETVAEALGRDIPVRITDAPLPDELKRGGGGVHTLASRPEAMGKSLVTTSRAPQDVSLTSPAVLPAREWRPAMLGGASGQHHLPLRYEEAAMSLTARSWRHSFEDFVVGPCNELAFAASRSMCKESGNSDILFLNSSPGLGKTHLLQAVGSQLCKECNYRLPKVEYLTAEEFASRLVQAFKANDTDRFKARHRDVDVLLLEDVHFLQGKEKMQDELLATIKTLQERGSKIIFSSSFAPRELRDMSAPLLSRLHSGFLAAIERPDTATRKKILNEKARLHHVVLPEEISNFLAESIDSDVRQIESCLRNLILKAKLLKSGITMQMAWEAVQHYAPRKKTLDLERIIAYVSQGYGISQEQLSSKSRKRELVTARNTVFYLARKHTSLSLVEIGGIFDRSHSTVIKGITNLEREISRESSLGRQIANAIAIIERNGGIISPSA